MSKYSNWTKDALISRILSLEAAANGSSVANGGSVANGSSAANGSDAAAVPAPAPLPLRKAARKRKELDFSQFTTRRVAIRFAYLGWDYHGLAFQRVGHRSVEGEILQALYRTRCIPSMDLAAINFTRCGRTDADVSAMSQVMALDVRSVLRAEDHADAAKDDDELDYLKILNSHLPAHIIAYEVCLRPPPGFSARFSCLSRHYHYYFVGANLDIAAMREAAARLVGEHDFRNFCKIDGSKQITNFKRFILESEIHETRDGMYYLSLRGTAFLWNQVRSIMAVLFLVGQHLEPVSTVDRLLDVVATPRRPAYEIVSGIPLVLYNCEYAPMEWRTSRYTSVDQLYNEWHEHMQKQSMSQLMLQVVQTHISARDQAAQQQEQLLRANVGSGVGNGKRAMKYVPLYQRPLCETPEVVNERWLAKDARKKSAKAALADSDASE